MRYAAPLLVACLLTLSLRSARAGTDGFPGFPPGFPPGLPPGTPGLPAPSTGAIRATGPFTGGLSESWESRENYLTPSFHVEPNPSNIMGGGASITSPSMGIYEPGQADFSIGLPPVNARVADGVKGLAVSGSSLTTTITFASPVSDFGAYWASGSPSDGVTVRFFNAAGSEIDAPVTFSYTRNGSYPGADGSLDWHGWQSSVPVSFVTFTGDFVAVDGLQAIVPEPAGALPSALAAASLLARRRRHAVLRTRVG